MEQRNATIAIHSALKADLAVKGSKRKKIDHWKAVACAVAGVSKMGSARYQKIIDYGIQNGYWEIELVGASQKPTLKPLNLSPAQTPAITEALDEVSQEPVERTAPPPVVRQVHPHQEIAGLPREGDLYYYQTRMGRKVQGEVLAVYCFVDMANPDGSCQTMLASDLSDTKRDVNPPQKLTVFYQDNRALRAERDQLLREIEALKAQRGALEQ